MKILKWFDKNFEEFLMIILLIMISVILIVQVFMRYCIGESLAWAEEASRYCWIVTTFLSIGYCTKRNCALRVDIITGMLSAKLKKIVEVVVDLIGVVVYGFVFINSFLTIEKMMYTNQLSPALRMPLWILYISATICFGVATTRAVQNMYLNLTYKKVNGGEQQ
nr:TRAP transporter small permease [Sedimentibacter sp.]